MSPTTERHFSVLGPVEVQIDGRRVDLGGPKPRALLAALLARRGQPISQDTLVDALWGDHPPATAHKSIQKYVSVLRRDLGKVLVTRKQGYLIDVPIAELDAAYLEAALPEARAKHEGWEVSLEKALSAWRDDPLPELADTAWGRAETTRLDELRLEGLELLMDQRLDRGEDAAVVVELEDLVGKHQFREHFWSQLMIALYRSGRQSDALDAFQRLRTTLGEELGIEPSPELSRLEERILLHDPGLTSAAISTTSHNLPSPLTSFIGRNREMEKVTRLLSASRLVTLLGPAGSGKTRLATEVGRSLIGSYADGPWFIDLAPVRSPDQVVAAIAKPLGVGHLAERPPEEVLAGYLEDRRVLLLLDNCEHLVTRVAALADRLLRAAPHLVIMATSRERLGVAGEVIFDVPPLPYPEKFEPVTEEFDAVRLFVDRARAVSPGEDLSSNRPIVGEIVRRLDGIPLALELAAARVRSLGLNELREGLDDRFSMLVSPTRPDLDRHQTLQAAVDWSYQLLDEREQTMFRRLSVFRGGFTLQAVSAVCAVEPLHSNMTPGLLGELVDKSLVTVDASQPERRRYGLLETLREFGQMVLDASEPGSLRDSHSAYFCSVAEEAARHLRGPEQTAWLAVLRDDHDNFRKALAWAATTSPGSAVRMAIALSPFWDSVGPRAEGHEWLKRAVDLSKHLDESLRVESLVQASDMFSSTHASIPRQYAEEALEAARASGDRVGEAKALRALSWALVLDESPDEALGAGLKALEIFESHGDPWELALCLERLAQGSYRDPESSIERLFRALNLYQKVGDRTREALVLYKIADRLASNLGDLLAARTYTEKAIDICDEMGNVHDGAHARLEYGKILRRSGEHDNAQQVLREALAQLTKSGDERCSVRTLTALGTTLIDAGDLAAGEEMLRESLRRGQSLGEIHTTRVALAGLARVLADAGRAPDAVVLISYVDHTGRRLELPVSEAAQKKRSKRLNLLRVEVGDDDFELFWERGRGLSMEEAIGLALAYPAG